MIGATHYAKALVDAYEAAPSASSAGKVLDQFVVLISEHRLTPLVPAILSAVKREISARLQRDMSTIEVAHEVSGTTFHMFMNPTVTENKKLIGGFTVKQAGRAIDASLSGALEQLRTAMKA